MSIACSGVQRSAGQVEQMQLEACMGAAREELNTQQAAMAEMELMKIKHDDEYTVLSIKFKQHVNLV